MKRKWVNDYPFLQNYFGAYFAACVRLHLLEDIFKYLIILNFRYYVKVSVYVGTFFYHPFINRYHKKNHKKRFWKRVQKSRFLLIDFLAELEGDSRSTLSCPYV